MAPAGTTRPSSPPSDENDTTVVPFADSPLREEAYRRVFAAVLLDPAASGTVAERAGLDVRRTMRVLGALATAGLVQSEDGRWTVVTARLAFTVDPAEVRAGTPIPRRAEAREAFLKQTVLLFEPGTSYPEAQVNEILGRVNPDFAALRRYLVEAQLLARANGIYVRAE